jgi:hypothetical protein
MRVIKEKGVGSIRKGFFSMVPQFPVGQALLITKASRSHSETSYSVGLLLTSDQPDAETPI